jgi:alpha-D-ribose 1-methylphosphonate 5-triphosphate synthase subunit PhnG
LSSSIDNLSEESPAVTEPAAPPATCDVDARRAAMAALARASAAELAERLASVPERPDCSDLRPVETGLVMLRGRIGGDGAPFNIGEATVTRAAVRLASGEVGFAYVLGRDRNQARLAAICDALWQNASFRPRIEREVLTPIRARIDGERDRRRGETAATRVEFFTLARGED